MYSEVKTHKTFNQDLLKEFYFTKSSQDQGKIDRK